MAGRAAALISMIILAACSGLRPVAPPQRPSENDIVANYSTFTQNFGSVSPSEYVKMGYRMVDADCDLFFEQLAQAGRSYDLLKRETVLGIATTSTVLALLHNSAATLALIAAGGALLSTTVDNVEDYALLTRYTTQLKAYVDQARTTFKQINDPSLVADDKFAADDFVRQYANICTIDGLEQTIAQSIANSMAVPGASATQQLATAAEDVQNDLGGTLPTVADLRTLAGLLEPAANSERRKTTTSGGKFASAAGVYWDKKQYALLPLGITRQIEIKAALSLNTAVSPPAAVPLGVLRGPGASARTLQPPQAPLHARSEAESEVLMPSPAIGLKSYATPLMNVPR